MAKVTMGVINDLATDQRVARMSAALQELGAEVQVIGRNLPQAAALLPQPWEQSRMPVWFNQNFFKFAEFNIRLLHAFLKTPTDVFYANDLDSLPAAVAAGCIRNKPVVYDSHEFFTGAPELEGAHFKKAFWKKTEAACLPLTKVRLTVNASIADLLKKTYGHSFEVIRNVPLPLSELKIRNTGEGFSLPKDKFNLILQGSGINVQRGAEELLEAMCLVPDHIHLTIAGGGDVLPLLKMRTEELGLHAKVTFLPRMPYPQLMSLTQQAQVGLSLDKPLSINYALSLPNKLFDYMQAGVPVIASNLIEIKNIIDRYKNGILIQEVRPETIAAAILQFADSPELWQTMRTQSQEAAKTLHWNEEKRKIATLFSDLL
jgi:glycosyltransferase involved in cell wall biosynthesis